MPVRNVARSILLKLCVVKLAGCGENECQVLMHVLTLPTHPHISCLMPHQQVQAQDSTHVWVCPVDETILSRGCVKFKKRTIEIAVSHAIMTCQSHVIMITKRPHTQTNRYHSVIRHTNKRDTKSDCGGAGTPTNADRNACMKLYVQVVLDTC